MRPRRIARIAPWTLCLLAPHLLADPPASVTYTYDDLGRLRTGQFSGGPTDGRKVDYQYDPAGNRTTMTSGMPLQLTVGAPTAVAEGSTLSFPVTRTGLSTQSITVNCVPQNGTATGGGSAPLDDFVTTTRQVTFLASDPSPTTKFCDIPTKTDSYYEGTQTVTATLQNASAGAIIVPPGSASGSINDVNSPPSFAVSGNTITEGASATFTITKTGLTELTHAVNYATADSSATTADSDYTAIALSTASFSSGDTQKTVSVSTTTDTKYELAETVKLDLSAPSNSATIATASALSTINNDDAAPSIVIDDAASVNEGSNITFVFRNTGNANTALSHSISWATANNTASAGSDYTASSGTVSFASGETTKSISVATLTDGVFDGGEETFFVNLTTNASTNGAVISDSQALGGIADIDNPVPSVPSGLRISSTPLPESPNYIVFWTASTGPVSYYQLMERPGVTYTINAPATSRNFSNKPPGEYYYSVRACSASNQCSAYSTEVYKLVCVGSGCQ
jgi:hypothetical protein